MVTIPIFRDSISFASDSRIWGDFLKARGESELDVGFRRLGPRGVVLARVVG